MNVAPDVQRRMMSAYQLLQQDNLSVAAFENIRTLLKGIHPVLDEKLGLCSQALDKLQKIQNIDVITLSAEALPEETEEKKKRKKALLFFINSLKDLKSEIKRINSEFDLEKKNNNSAQAKIKGWGRIFGFAKGPFGIVTIAALVIVVIFLLVHKNKVNISKTSSKPKIQVIVVNGKQIPLTQLFVGHGPDCDSPHYHALNEISAKALDGTILKDPGGCGFGKVKDIEVLQVDVSSGY